MSAYVPTAHKRPSRWCKDCGLTPVKDAGGSCSRCEREATLAARQAAKMDTLCEACGENEATDFEPYCDSCEDAMIEALANEPGERCEGCGFLCHDVVFGQCGSCYNLARRTTSQRVSEIIAKSRPAPAAPRVPPFHTERQTLAARRQKVSA